MSQKRIEFIDLAKGICIICILLGHCGIAFSIPGISNFVMPAFFILSGLFFKEYDSAGTFLVKKINGLLVPFLFLYLSVYAVFYGLKFYAPNLLITDARGITDIFHNRQYFNGPIWFLLCLFWCNIIFSQITLNVKKDWLRIVLVAILGFFGWFLGQEEVFMPMFIDVAFTALPFFAFGYYLKKSEILYTNRLDKYNILFALLFWAVAFVLTRTTDYRLSLHYNGLEGWSTYLISITSVLAVLFLCKTIKHIPFVSYV